MIDEVEVQIMLVSPTTSLGLDIPLIKAIEVITAKGRILAVDDLLLVFFFCAFTDRYKNAK